jgi:hypothetical protein
MVLGYVPFTIMSDSPALHSRCFSNSSHFEWGRGCGTQYWKGDHPSTIQPKFTLIWFSGFRGEDLNVIFYQNMPNLHNRYNSAERKISQKNPEYLLNCSLSCSCSQNLSSFWLILKQQWTIKMWSHLNHLLWNCWTKLNQTWQWWYLGRSLSQLCPTAPPSIQDGRCY